MFFKTWGVACDGNDETCSAEIECQGSEATRVAAARQARKEGWIISNAGHFCPQHHPQSNP